MKKLRAPQGTDEANFGTERYRVDNDGVVEVPDDAVQSLVDVGGFQEVVDAPVVPDGHVVMRSTIGPQSCSFDGREFATDDAGCVTVPSAAVSALVSHGFEVADQPVVEPGASGPIPPVLIEAASVLENVHAPAPDAPPAPLPSDEPPQA